MNPLIASMPIMPMSSPSTAIASVLMIEPPERYASTNNPSSSSAEYSGGPNFSAMAASGGASSISPITEIVPATNDPIAAIASAAPARPLRVIAYPSMQVITDAASPGMRMRIEVVEPPYIAP